MMTGTSFLQCQQRKLRIRLIVWLLLKIIVFRLLLFLSFFVSIKITLITIPLIIPIISLIRFTRCFIIFFLWAICLIIVIVIIIFFIFFHIHIAKLRILFNYPIRCIIQLFSVKKSLEFLSKLSFMRRSLYLPNIKIVPLQ